MDQPAGDSPQTFHDGAIRWPFLLGVFLVSAGTLHLEILQTRVFSVLLWHHVTYLVVTFTLLGFAASGTLLALVPRFLERNPARFLAVCSLLFALTVHGAFQFLGRREHDTLTLAKNRAEYLTVFVDYLYLVVPYVFAGLVIVGALKVSGKRSGVVYAANLGGSAAGCLLFAFTLTPLGGAGAVLFAAAVTGLGALAFASSAGSAGRRSVLLTLMAGVVALVSAGGIPWGDSLLPFRAAKSKVMVYAMGQAEKAGQASKIVSTAWDPLCRIDVVDLGSEQELRVFQDADAPTTIFAEDRELDPASIYNLAYRVLDKGPNVLVIGVGGGPDLRQALWNEARSVTGVEINRTTARLMRTEFAEFSGDIYHAPGVEVIETEGRSFIRRDDQKYDLIQMTGTDTYAALSSGSYVLSESYLYTIEAFRDYFDHLSDDGAVCVLRFRFFPPRETLRLMAIAVEAMRQHGIEEPHRHVLAVDNILLLPVPGPDPDGPPKIVRMAYTSMVFKKRPFETEQLQAARDFVERHSQAGALAIAYAPDEDGSTEFHQYFQAVRDGREEEFEDGYDYRISPVTDDSPFFFNFHRWANVFREKPSEDGSPPAELQQEGDLESAYFTAIGEDPIGLFLLVTALGESALLVVLLVVLPLLFSKQARMPRDGRGAVLLYFLGLGVGFLFLEIACMQRMILYLGHPTRSITVVLFSFLLFSGAGSLVAGRFRDPRKVAKAALLIVAMIIAAYSVFLPKVLAMTLGYSTTTRIALALGILAVPSFFMGMPFPSALALLRGPHASFIPWAFAINGGASVVASVAAIFLAMAFGFNAVFWLALGFYLLAFTVHRGLPSTSV